MSFSNTPGQRSSPEAVLNELKQIAERKAAYKMFYSAADVFREYTGPYTAETATERVRLTEEYEQRGREAEKQRLEGGPRIITPKPASPPQPYRPPTPRPVSTTTPKPAGSPTRVPLPPKPRDSAPPPQVIDGMVHFQCRWCKETIAFEVAKGGEILRCAKCDCLVSVPKVN